MLRLLAEEVPHGVAVSIESMKEYDSICHIEASIICERDSHKGIIIGKGGKMLKKIGLLILTDQVWGRVTANREKRRATWVYQDEFHVLLADPQTAAYSVEIFRRFRKWGAIPSGITQNVKSLLESSEIESIFGNCDFLYLLSQAAGDREVLASHLGISPHQLSYVTHSGSGEGLLFYGDTAIPFVDRFPKDTELYTLLTTKPEDKANERKDE